ncbi:MAG: hypothetical protein K2M49_07395 [Muribaculaceae bacterium]|nr:hypothetical protein [Muribaculaceae bacterium]
MKPLHKKYKEKIIIKFLIINNPTIMKTLTKISGALIIAALATGGTYFQNLKTKQYIYNDITLADLNAFLGSENNGSNPENGGSTDPETGGSTDPETGGSVDPETGLLDDLIDIYLRQVWKCKDVPCPEIGDGFNATVPVKLNKGETGGVFSWICFTCSNLWDSIVNSEQL